MRTDALPDERWRQIGARIAAATGLHFPPERSPNCSAESRRQPAISARAISTAASNACWRTSPAKRSCRFWPII